MQYPIKDLWSSVPIIALNKWQLGSDILEVMLISMKLQFLAIIVYVTIFSDLSGGILVLPIVVEFLMLNPAVV